MPTGPPVDDAYCFWRYRDLLARRIVTDRVDLHRKQTARLSASREVVEEANGAVALFSVVAVKQWVLANMASGDPDDRLCDRPRRQPAREIEHSAAE